VGKELHDWVLRIILYWFRCKEYSRGGATAQRGAAGPLREIKFKNRTVTVPNHRYVSSYAMAGLSHPPAIDLNI